MPTAPQNLDHTEPDVINDMFNITLTWSIPDPPNGIITQYNVSGNANCNNFDIVYCYRYLILLLTRNVMILQFY